jgi:hypothetical protein
MTNTSQVPRQQEVKRIGILLADLGKFNIPVLKFLVLQMNTLQQTFEYEFLPAPREDKFLQTLSPGASLDREVIRQDIPSFLDRYLRYLEGMMQGYHIKDSKLSTDRFILVTMSCFKNNYFTMREKGLSFLALGNWERSMAPPSIVEFILSLIVRESVASISPSLRGPIHLGTKGCICDFTASLSEIRLKVLTGFVCNYCRSALQADGLDTLADELVRVLRKEWIGKSTDPDTPAGIAANLGYDLFISRGIKASKWENFLIMLQQEGVKQLITILGAVVQFILIALLIIWPGLKK